MSGLHIVRKLRKGLDCWYVYAWRGGPCIYRDTGARPVVGPELLAKAMLARADRARAYKNSFNAVIDDYRISPEFSRLANSTQRDYRLWLDRISERFGKTPLIAFEDRKMRGVIITWRDLWAEHPRTADKASIMMSTILGWATERAILSVNVASRIRQLHQVNKADQIWEDRHWQALHDAKAPPQLLDALELARLTGLRLGDLIRLEWSHVGPMSIVIENRKRKGRAVIPILPELRTLLKARDHREGTILRTSRGTAWTESGLGSVFQKSKPEGFDRTIHDLRGTYVTWLATKGLTDEEIARIVGWTARRVGEIRARYVDEARVVISLEQNPFTLAHSQQR